MKVILSGATALNPCRNYFFSGDRQSKFNLKLEFCVIRLFVCSFGHNPVLHEVEIHVLDLKQMFRMFF